MLTDAQGKPDDGETPEERRFQGSATIDGYQVTHRSLIGQVVAGDNTATTRFWRIYAPLLDKCAMRFGIKGADLEEFRVDTMAAFLDGAGHFEYDPTMRFQTYFYTVVKHAAFKYIEKRERHNSRIVSADRENDLGDADRANVENYSDGSTGITRIEEDEWTAYMAAKAHELMKTRVPARTFQIFVFLEKGNDIDAICRALGIRKTVVYEHKQRALDAYRDILAALNDPRKMFDMEGDAAPRT